MTIRERLAALLIGADGVEAIRDSLTGQQSGTARRVRRMYEEALK